MALKKIFIIVVFLGLKLCDALLSVSHCEYIGDALTEDTVISGELLRSISPCGQQQCKKLCGHFAHCIQIGFDAVSLSCTLLGPPQATGSTVTLKTGVVSLPKSAYSVCSVAGCQGKSECFRTKPGSSICHRECPSGYTLETTMNECMRWLTPFSTLPTAKSTCEEINGRLPILNTREKLNSFMQTTLFQQAQSAWLAAKFDTTYQVMRWDNGEDVISDILPGSGTCLVLDTADLKTTPCARQYHRICIGN